MPHDIATGRIYRETISGVTYGIDPDDVGPVIGELTGDWGVLCTSSNINRWSMHKPIERNNPSLLTDQYIVGANYGLTINKKLISALSSGYTEFYWDYTVPSRWYQILDFDGYLHYATPPSIYIGLPYLRTNTASSVSFEFSGDGSDIQVMDIAVPETDQASAQSRVLSSWNVVFLIYIPGHNLQLYNTGHTLYEHQLQSAYDISAAVTAADLGKTAKVMAALVYPNSGMAVGLQEVTGAFMTHNWVVPLNFDDNYNALKTVTITQFYWLENMNVNYTAYRPVSTGHNYYALTDLSVVATANNMGSETIAFKARMYINRSGTFYYSNEVNQTLTNTRTVAPFLWEFNLNASGEVNFGSAFWMTTTTTTQPQSGDVVGVEVQVLNSGGTVLQTSRKTVQTIS